MHSKTFTESFGSLVKEVSSGASLGNLVEMYPYGTRNTLSARTSAPFVYVGAHGYYNDSSDRDYVRARSLTKKSGRWMQTDPLWPDEMAFGYAINSPLSAVDPAGAMSYVAHPEMCHACAHAIYRQWFPLPAHRCNACFAHCMACCVLTGLGGEDEICALKAQTLQNIVSNPGEKYVNDRNRYCERGYLIGRNIIRSLPKDVRGGHIHRECSKACLTKCPWKKPNPRKECDKKFFIDPNGNVVPRFPKFPLIPACDPILIECMLR